MCSSDLFPSHDMGWTGVDYGLGDFAWFGTNTGRVFKSNDKGATWTVYDSGQDNISSLSFADENNGVAICQVVNSTSGAVDSWTMIKTADGGQTWTEIAVADQYLSDVSAVPGEVGMFVGTKISQTAGSNFSAYSQVLQTVFICLTPTKDTAWEILLMVNLKYIVQLMVVKTGKLSMAQISQTLKLMRWVGLV